MTLFVLIQATEKKRCGFAVFLNLVGPTNHGMMFGWTIWRNNASFPDPMLSLKSTDCPFTCCHSLCFFLLPKPLMHYQFTRTCCLIVPIEHICCLQKGYYNNKTQLHGKPIKICACTRFFIFCKYP